ncbi:putative ABC-type ATPase [Paenibacillus sp. 4624]|uniref:hypothetical protein n=1 Tax=Paenibacillus TaxID=44249 RepID=UPI00186451CB|nr:hypothetical protein [Paenibacillus amylolyticus]
MKNLTPALTTADRVVIIDNTYEPIIVAEIMKEQLIYRVDLIPAWANPILAQY